MTFEPLFTEEFTKELNKLDKTAKETAVKQINKIIENPFRQKPLHGESNLFRARFLKYRIVYKIEKDQILFLRLGKRDEVYG